MNEFSSCIFYLLIYVSKLMNMCLMRTQLFRWSDLHVAPPTVLTRRAVVIYHRTTHDAGGDFQGHPNRSVAPNLTDAVANHPTDGS
jgi:hypothetical protein